jgi:hypothetical protein
MCPRSSDSGTSMPNCEVHAPAASTTCLARNSWCPARTPRTVVPCITSAQGTDAAARAVPSYRGERARTH